ncbi:MAG: hypothetical protein QXW98_06795 [Candidatus Caldarchaeum sp.]
MTAYDEMVQHLKRQDILDIRMPLWLCVPMSNRSKPVANYTPFTTLCHMNIYIMPTSDVWASIVNTDTMYFCFRAMLPVANASCQSVLSVLLDNPHRIVFVLNNVSDKQDIQTLHKLGTPLILHPKAQSYYRVYAILTNQIIQKWFTSMETMFVENIAIPDGMQAFVYYDFCTASPR